MPTSGLPKINKTVKKNIPALNVQGRDLTLLPSLTWLGSSLDHLLVSRNTFIILPTSGIVNGAS
ncbi:hypothetical protein A3B45_05550 [Candidatus Daviesbacteria bacterium RIFCSPLOWO2_01_FULL_39_12]|uniref:Uncharacterized protein n=1 Tax=Candidatus Daviesbacteria bacterium RIFCSPLOWO2_01_FULL_39_12 TaxID=1797785 RepID=A0A1F5KPT0_9BACT|nr:MAG: hypothetical protein A3B45_05550 [Candidatus Daviesbacteria bacterium RIFCSPLOWO2_01_FULL_39_12]